MLKLLKFLNQQPRGYVIALGVIGATLVGVVDYVTGSEFVFSIFYLIPIGLMAWLVGRRAGIAISVLSALLALAADLLVGADYSLPAVPYWNAAILLGMFLIVTYALTSLHDAQERQRELEQFIVHDLRSPLANVMTALEAMRDLGGESLDATQKNLLEMCEVSSTRMLTLINSLLDLASLESKQMPLQRDLVPAAELVDQSLSQVSVWAQRNRVSLTPQLAADIKTVYVDRVLIVRVLVNLLSNAIKFSPANSIITVRVSSASAGWVAFRVSDQGRGIPKEWSNKVFDKFVQVEARRSGSVPGSGLGLTFCREAIEVQGGRIWIEEGSNPGTTVVFTVPENSSTVRR